jgi:hypothetical protein
MAAAMTFTGLRSFHPKGFQGGTMALPEKTPAPRRRPHPTGGTNATAPGTSLMRSHSQWLPSKAEEEPQAVRVPMALTTGPFRRRRSSERLQRGGKNAQQTAQMSNRGDSGKRLPGRRGTSRSNSPSRRSDRRNGGTDTWADHHRRATRDVSGGDDTGDHERVADYESNETPRLLTPPRAATTPSGTASMRGPWEPPAGVRGHLYGTVARAGYNSGTFRTARPVLDLVGGFRW